MRKLTLLAALAAATAFTAPAHAGDPNGKLQVKLLGTGVLVDGEITEVRNDPLALTPGAQTDINNNVIPTVAIEYYATPSVSVETICCLTQHHASGVGALEGAALIDHIMILPATVTLKYHLNAGPVKPYVGVGPSVFFFIDEKPGATAAALGVDRVKLSNKVGFALQAGLDIPVNDTGLGISVDGKKYFMDTVAHFEAGGTEVLTTEHKLDPWVVSAGVYYRF
ncbi:outer membrane protein [Novosphingobium marinum]|uniref:Outer membrane protein n=1 Tax=Novosphingobium marinum TaxID=1514948 RepID=A0A7Y9XW19_9SPHN|nr:OmpW family outer membrane protein [Novosphingobium marinum]NYH95567.1 outer membrane protein [Novosphingobium marinum]GGC28105.1 outer membrane protein [Novosphingobium marinum]